MPNPTLQRVTAILLLGVFLWLAAACTYNQQTATSSYTEVFYPSGNLRIQAYLYKPHGNGLLPVFIYNHGKRMRQERRSVPAQHVGMLLSRAGYAALVTERRG
jgi:acetyl esterase/lipase